MIDIRKVIVFLFVMIHFICMVRLVHFIEKWKLKRYIFITLLSGISCVAGAAFLDIITAYFDNYLVYYSIKILFTVGAALYVMGIILWNGFTREIINRLEILTLTDPLTGVLNRNGIEKVYRLLINEEKNFYVVVCDLNGTKKINDIYGHIEGDKYIKKTTGIILDEIGSGGHLARFGGDEFIILLEQSESSEISKIIYKIKNRVRELYPGNLAGISMGYALCSGENLNFMELIRTADAKMYMDKKNNVTEE